MDVSETKPFQTKLGKPKDIEIIHKEKIKIKPSKLLSDLQPPAHKVSKSEFHIQQEIVSPTNLYGL